MARSNFQLTILKVKNARPGKYCDGGNLWLYVSAGGAKNWVFRYMREGRAREMGLGGFPDTTLAEARELAAGYRKQSAGGVDPLEHRKEERKRSALQSAQGLSFTQCAQAFIEAHQPGWKNAKHAKQWSSTLATYGAPVLGELPVAEVGTDHVMRVLSPIWNTKNETASRVRGRIESVLDWARVRGYREGDNPARWRGHLDKLLAKRAGVAKVRHHRAMAYADLPSFKSRLIIQDGMAALALAFTILTAARTSEALNATWDEIDLNSKTWTVTADRMKAGVAHRVPLSSQAVALITQCQDSQSSEFVFPGARYNRPLSSMSMLMLLRRMGLGDVTVHGFRSSFRDWCAEQTPFSREVAEAALAHVLANKAEAAYRRGDIFDKRAELMQAWADFVGGNRPTESIQAL